MSKLTTAQCEQNPTATPIITATPSAQIGLNVATFHVLIAGFMVAISIAAVEAILMRRKKSRKSEQLNWTTLSKKPALFFSAEPKPRICANLKSSLTLIDIRREGAGTWTG